MKESLVPIDHAGRIVLPKGIRDELAIKPGDTFKISINGSTVALTLNSETAGLVRKGKALVFSTIDDKILSNETVSTMLESSRQERELTSRINLAPRRKKS